jgi:hypothetical protein
MKRSQIFFTSFILGAVAIGICTAARAGTIVSSTFDSSVDGWTNNSTTGEVTWQSTGGNPGGYVNFTDNSPSATEIFAPSKFLGNYIAMGVTSISFDFNVFAETNVTDTSPYAFGLSGPGGVAVWDGNLPGTVPTGWVTNTASISGGAGAGPGWTLESGSWTGLLSDVTEFGIVIEIITNDQSQPWTDIEGIDNVILSGNVSPTPLPATLPLFAGGLGFFGYLTRRRKRYASALAAA